MSKNKTLKVGMKVKYRTMFGFGGIRVATVESIELCEHEGDKDGESVSEVPWNELYRSVITLSNNSWAYGTQVDCIAD